jgi:hypothetical protein
MMKVKELIKLLQDAPSDATIEVAISEPDDVCWWSIETVDVTPGDNEHTLIRLGDCTMS